MARTGAWRGVAAAMLGVLASPAGAATIMLAPGGDAQQRIQDALIEAQPGDVIMLAAGRYAFTDGLSLDVARVTLRGAGPEATILDFSGQLAGGEGLRVTADDVVLRGFAVENARGNGIKSKDADRIVYHDLRVEWTGGPKPENGAYGIYPVASRDVLIDRVTVKGASDAGIYVGQSRNVIVRRSTAMFNVAGIEVENCYNVDVHDNVAQHNAGGILVFDLPDLPQKGGHAVRVFANDASANDTPNFAPKGNIVAAVPTGTGVIVMASRDVHVFANRLGDNATANVMIIAYPRTFTDAGYDPLPRDVLVRDNVHGRAGWAPQLTGGRALAPAAGGPTFPVLWDGAGSGIVVRDSVATLSLGLAIPGTPIAQAKPMPVAFPAGAVLPEPPAVVLPPTMEAMVR
ncbi:MAG: parallel beta-helix domain-containing protein [Rhizorhabdus sp.]